MKKLSVYDQIVFKHLKMRKDGYQTNFYMNSHLQDDLRIEFIV